MGLGLRPFLDPNRNNNKKLTAYQPNDPIYQIVIGPLSVKKKSRRESSAIITVVASCCDEALLVHARSLVEEGGNAPRQHSGPNWNFYKTYTRYLVDITLPENPGIGDGKDPPWPQQEQKCALFCKLRLIFWLSAKVLRIIVSRFIPSPVRSALKKKKHTHKTERRTHTNSFAAAVAAAFF